MEGVIVADAVLPWLAPTVPGTQGATTAQVSTAKVPTPSFLQTTLGCSESWNLLPWEGVQVVLSAFHWYVRPAKFPSLNAAILMSNLLLGPQAPHLPSCLPWKSLHHPAWGIMREKAQRCLVAGEESP